MKNKKQLILRRIMEIYEDYSMKIDKGEVSSYITQYNEFDLDVWALKVLVDIYTYDDKKEEENRLIYQDWDLIEFMITDVLKND